MRPQEVRDYERQKWHHTLTPLKEQQADPGSITICWERPQTRSWDTSRLYSRFLCPFDFVRFSLSVPEADRCFYEVSGMGSEGLVKPFFDLDLYADSEAEAISRGRAILEALMDTIVEVVGEGYDEARDAFICRSEGAVEDGFKFSVHLVVNGISCTMPQAKQLAQECYALLHGQPDRDALDLKVYTSGRLWRAAYSHKLGSSRTKLPISTQRLVSRLVPCGKKTTPSWVTYLDDPSNGKVLSIMQHTERFERSQVSARSVSWAEDSVSYTPWRSRMVLPSSPEVKTEHSALEEGALELARERLSDLEGGWVADLSADGTLITCKRTRSGHCPICERVHAKENAFVTMGKKGLTFRCHRDTQNRGYLLVPSTAK